MAGYSGTPLSKKLGIKPGARVALVRAPVGFERVLKPLPDGVRLRTQARASADVVLFFATRFAELERRFDGFARAIAPSHTPVDGDVIFTLATGERPGAAAAGIIGALAAEVVADAIVRAATQADGLPGLPAVRDFSTIP